MEKNFTETVSDDSSTKSSTTIRNDEHYYYALTWAPNSKKRPYVANNKMNHSYYMDIIRNALGGDKTEMLVFTPELTLNGELHYHFAMELTKRQRVTLYKSGLQKLKYKGFTCLKEWLPGPEWSEYILKDADMMEEVLDTKLPYTKESLKRHLIHDLNMTGTPSPLDFGLPC